MKKFFPFIIIFLVLFVFLIYCLFYKKDFNIKISVYFENKSPFELDNTYCKKLSEELLNIKGVKDVLTISSYSQCDIYIRSFFIFKNSDFNSIILQKVQNTINNLNFHKDFVFIDYDFRYDKKYNYLVVFAFKNLQSQNFFDIEEKITNELLFKKFVSKFAIIPRNPFLNTVYFDCSQLKNFKTDIEDLKNLIQNNNLNKTTSFINNSNSSFLINTDSDIKNITDIENITLNYPDKSFCVKFKDIFKIKEEFNNYQYEISKNKLNAIILSIAKKPYIPSFIFENAINKIITSNNNSNIDITLINASKLAKLKLDCSNRNEFSDIRNTIFQKFPKINCLFFYNIDSPLIFRNDKISDISNSSLSVLCFKSDFFKLKKYLKIPKNKPKTLHIISNSLESLNLLVQDSVSKYFSYSILYTFLKPEISYLIDNYSLNDYAISKKEIINSICSSNQGLITDYYGIDSFLVPIVLKNSSKTSPYCIYAKSGDILYDINSFVKTDLKNSYYKISRLNSKFYARVNIF